MEITISKAQRMLPELCRLARLGVEIILTQGQKRIPVARLVPVGPPHPKDFKPRKRSGKRQLGLYVGKVDLGPEFFKPLPEEELALLEGPIIALPSDEPTPHS